MFRSKSDKRPTLFRKGSRFEDLDRESRVVLKKTIQPLMVKRKQELPNIHSPFLKKTVQEIFAEPDEELVSPMKQFY